MGLKLAKKGLFFHRSLTNLNACPNDRVPNEAFGNYRPVSVIVSRRDLEGFADRHAPLQQPAVAGTLQKKHIPFPVF